MIDLSRFTPDSDRVFVIAEAGVNHNGDIEIAMRLVDEAIKAGCDAVKFQLWNTEHIYPASRVGRVMHDQMAALELSREQMVLLKAYCDARGILFFATPDELADAQFLAGLGVELMKTSSHDVTNLEMLRGIRALGVPTIMSTGAASLLEINDAWIALEPAAALHCVSAYPAPLDQMNLRALRWLEFGGPRGLSDHTLGIAAACASLALGARIFEKHFTLGRYMRGPDHAASASIPEMKEYVSTLRALAIGLGDGVKRIMPCEAAARAKFKPWLSTAS